VAGEKDLYKKIKDWAYKTYGEINPDKRTGLLKIAKLSMLGMYGDSGWQDMAIFIKDTKRLGHLCLMELKNPAERWVLSAKQAQRKRETEAMGFGSYVVDNFDEACRVIEMHVAYAQGRTPHIKWPENTKGILE
jgi:hypothetical protein